MNKSDIELKDFYHKIEIYLSMLPVIIMIAGSIGNTIAFYVLTRKRLRIYSTMLYFASLTVMDTISLYQWNFNYFYRYHFNTNHSNLEESSLFLCRYVSFMAYFSLQTSAWILALICIDRYLILTNSRWKRKFSKNIKYTIIIIVCIILTVALLNMPVTFLNGTVKYKNITDINNPKIIISQKEEIDCYTTAYMIMWEKVILCIECILPLMIMITFNSLLIYKTYISSIKCKIRHDTRHHHHNHNHNNENNSQRRNPLLQTSSTLTKPIIVYSLNSNLIIENKTTTGNMLVTSEKVSFSLLDVNIKEATIDENSCMNTSTNNDIDTISRLSKTALGNNDDNNNTTMNHIANGIRHDEIIKKQKKLLFDVSVFKYYSMPNLLANNGEPARKIILDDKNENQKAQESQLLLLSPYPKIIPRTRQQQKRQDELIRKDSSKSNGQLLTIATNSGTGGSSVMDLSRKPSVLSNVSFRDSKSRIENDPNNTKLTNSNEIIKTQQQQQQQQGQTKQQRLKTHTKMSQNRNRKIIIMLVLLTTSFAISTFPPSMFYSFFRPFLRDKPYKRVITLTFGLLRHLSHSFNFLIYFKYSSMIKQELNQIIDSKKNLLKTCFLKAINLLCCCCTCISKSIVLIDTKDKDVQVNTADFVTTKHIYETYEQTLGCINNNNINNNNNVKNVNSNKTNNVKIKKNNSNNYFDNGFTGSHTSIDGFKNSTNSGYNNSGVAFNNNDNNDDNDEKNCEYSEEKVVEKKPIKLIKVEKRKWRKVRYAIELANLGSKNKHKKDHNKNNNNNNLNDENHANVIE